MCPYVGQAMHRPESRGLASSWFGRQPQSDSVLPPVLSGYESPLEAHLQPVLAMAAGVLRSQECARIQAFIQRRGADWEGPYSRVASKYPHHLTDAVRSWIVALPSSAPCIALGSSYEPLRSDYRDVCFVRTGST